MVRLASSVDCREMLKANLAMNEYYVVTGSRFVLSPSLREEPKLEDFYVPSEDQKTREVLFIILGMGAVGYMSYTLLKDDSK